MKKEFKRIIPGGSHVKVSLNTDRLEAVHSMLLAKYVTRVGILGNKASRHNTITTRTGEHRAGRGISPQTNAEIGLIHEKGSLSLHIPRRSFLEMPLVLKSEGLLAIRNKLWTIFTQGEQNKERLKEAYRNLGILAERIIQAAFETRGFGRWLPDSAQTIARKKSDAPLIDTGQLRRSITSDVVAK